MDPATLAAAISLGITVVDGIVKMAEAAGATPEQLADLRKKIAEQTLATRSRFDSAQAAAEARLTGT